MMKEFEEKLEALTNFALDVDNAPLDVFSQLELDDLEKLKTYIGTEEPYLPPGHLDHLDRKSPEWAQLSTDFRRDFEKSVFTAASLLPEEGLAYLVKFIFETPSHTIDPMHWEYACMAAMEYLTNIACQDEEAAHWIVQIVKLFEVYETPRGHLFSVFLDGLVIPEKPLEQDVLQRILTLVEKGGESGTENLDWMFALKFREAAPALAMPIAQGLLDQLGKEGHACQAIEDLNYLVQLQQFFPGNPVLLSSFHRTAELWLSNSHFEDGLYWCIAVWNYQEYAAFLPSLDPLLGRLQRIGEGQPPTASEEEVPVSDLARLRAQMLLYKLGDEAVQASVKTYLDGVKGDYAEEEWQGLQDWLG